MSTNTEQSHRGSYRGTIGWDIGGAFQMSTFHIRARQYLCNSLHSPNIFGPPLTKLVNSSQNACRQSTLRSMIGFIVYPFSLVLHGPICIGEATFTMPLVVTEFSFVFRSTRVRQLTPPVTFVILVASFVHLSVRPSVRPVTMPFVLEVVPLFCAKSSGEQATMSDLVCSLLPTYV